MDALTEKARIAKVVFVLRKLSKKTQSKLAQTIEKTFQQVQKYENAKNSLSSPLLFAMAKSNGWDYNLLFNGKPDEMVQLLPLRDQETAKKKFLDIDNNIAEERKLQRVYAPLMPKLNKELAGVNTLNLTIKKRDPNEKDQIAEVLNEMENEHPNLKFKVTQLDENWQPIKK